MMHRKSLLKKYVANQLTHEERAWLLADFTENPHHPDYEAVMQKLWEETARASLLPAARSQHFKRLFEKQRQESARPSPAARRGWATHWAHAAAIAGILVVSSLIWFFIFHKQQQVVATAYGETRTITLPDHTQVVLNANSSIRYPSDWPDDAAREVWLDGEAYFSVTHTADHRPFLVHVNEAVDVKVLGTEFNVKDRRDVTQVVLTSGRVAVSVQHDDARQTVAMEPGELTEFSGAQRAVSKKQVNPEQYVAWRARKMVFEKKPLQEIARQLEDIYGITITIEDRGLATTKLTGAFPTHNLAVVLESLPTVVAMTIEKTNEDHYVFKQP